MTLEFELWKTLKAASRRKSFFNKALQLANVDLLFETLWEGFLILRNLTSNNFGETLYSKIIRVFALNRACIWANPWIIKSNTSRRQFVTRLSILPSVELRFRKPYSSYLLYTFKLSIF